MSVYVKTQKYSLQNKFKISMRNKTIKKWSKVISIFCASQFQFDAIYTLYI